MTLDFYNKDWEKFEKYIEEKIKGKCEISNKNWLKLRDFHFEQFIKTVPHPYGFIFRMIYKERMHKKIPCIYKLYYKYRKIREKELELQSGVTKKPAAQAFKRYR
jgi:hypothetical protein